MPGHTHLQTNMSRGGVWVWVWVLKVVPLINTHERVTVQSNKERQREVEEQRDSLRAMEAEQQESTATGR